MGLAVRLLVCSLCFVMHVGLQGVLPIVCHLSLGSTGIIIFGLSWPGAWYGGQVLLENLSQRDLPVFPVQLHRYLQVASWIHLRTPPEDRHLDARYCSGSCLYWLVSAQSCCWLACSSVTSQAVALCERSSSCGRRRCFWLHSLGSFALQTCHRRGGWMPSLSTQCVQLCPFDTRHELR